MYSQIVLIAHPDCSLTSVPVFLPGIKLQMQESLNHPVVQSFTSNYLPPKVLHDGHILKMKYLKKIILNF